MASHVGMCLECSARLLQRDWDLLSLERLPCVWGPGEA